jgi:hypothetical protein
MNISAPKLCFAILALLGPFLAYSGFGSSLDPPERALDGVWAGMDTNFVFGSEPISIKLNTNGYGAFIACTHNVGIPGTFTYTLIKEQIVFVTNDSPPLTGMLNYDPSSDVLIYQESSNVATSVGLTYGPVLMLRDTNKLGNAMLGSIIGATNYSDVMNRLGHFIGALTNKVTYFDEKSTELKTNSPTVVTNGEQLIRTGTNVTSSALGFGH